MSAAAPRGGNPPQDERELLDELRQGDGTYYVAQEMGMAPGIAGDWPAVIRKPGNKNGRLVKRRWPTNGVSVHTPDFSAVFAMPSRWTFSIPPVAEFLARHLRGASVIVDPFCGRSTIATHRNDLGQGGEDAAPWLRKLLRDGLRADAVLFDPPYSPRQVAECYKNIGRKASSRDTQNARLYGTVRRLLDELLAVDGIALSFGWQSAGFGKGWHTKEVLLVQHGGAHNDTICVAQERF